VRRGGFLRAFSCAAPFLFHLLFNPRAQMRNREQLRFACAVDLRAQSADSQTTSTAFERLSCSITSARPVGRRDCPRRLTRRRFGYSPLILRVSDFAAGAAEDSCSVRFIGFRFSSQAEICCPGSPFSPKPGPARLASPFKPIAVFRPLALPAPLWIRGAHR